MCYIVFMQILTGENDICFIFLFEIFMFVANCMLELFCELNGIVKLPLSLVFFIKLLKYRRNIEI